jgi:hypothetical protein
MIVGLGVAADLVNKNLSLYQNHMMAMRDLLEHLLTVSQIGISAKLKCSTEL